MLLLIGPVPWFGFELTLTLGRLMGALDGFAAACIMVTTFSRGYNDAIDEGFKDDIKTSTMVSGKNQAIDNKVEIDARPFQVYGNLSITWAALWAQPLEEFWSINLVFRGLQPFLLEPPC